MAASEPFRLQERVDEVAQKQHRENQTERELDAHRVLLEPLASAGVRRGEQKEDEHGGDEQDVFHGFTSTTS
jgi:hypothetical protein